MNMDDEEALRVSRALMAETGLSVVDAARLALELRESLPQHLPPGTSVLLLCRHIIHLGSEAYASESRTVSFRVAVEQSLLSRAARRLRTLAEIRQCCRRVLRARPVLADMPVRRISSEFCRELIEDVYSTPATRRKARSLLHGIFEFCLRRGWCAVNPLQAVDVPSVREKRIRVLAIAQVRHLLAMTCMPEHLPCAPAVGLMLWAGIRPTELTRLRWGDIRVDDRVINIDARHSKTGGTRHVCLRPVLLSWLREVAPYRIPQALIVPRAWVRRWRALRHAAGFADWDPDALRHTFASYHLRYFRDFNALQIDMGHADTQLLRTRYLGMRGITFTSASEFWEERGAVFRNAIRKKGEGRI